MANTCRIPRIPRIREPLVVASKFELFPYASMIERNGDIVCENFADKWRVFYLIWPDESRDNRGLRT